MLYRTQTILAGLLATSALAGLAPTALAQDAQTPDDEVIVTGRYIPNEKRATSEINSTMDQATFEATGAGDIADALTRVTGLSISQGKFILVRGLNERYSNATLNGAPLPSPEPLRRVAPLDLFPTSLLKGVVVQKTYSPEYGAEFGGGLISMKTEAVPSERFLNLSVSGSYNTETTGQEGYVYAGSDTDWLGYDDGLRKMPTLDSTGNLAAGENFENFRTLIVNTQPEIPVNFGGRISAGNRYDIGGGKSLGILASVGYDNSWTTRHGEDNVANIASGGTLNLLDDGWKDRTQNDISLNGLLTIGVELDDNNEIKATGLITRKSSALTRIETGVNREDIIYRNDYTEWYEREMYLGQLIGKHNFPSLHDMELTWRASYSGASRYAPYQRKVAYQDYEDGLGYRFLYNRQATDNTVDFSNLDDETKDLGADFKVPVMLSNMPVDVKFGAAYLDKTRDTSRDDFYYFGSVPAELRESRVDLIFSDPVIDAGILEIRRTGTSGFPDIANAGLEVQAAYAGIDAEVNERLRFAIGGRFEHSEQTTQTSIAYRDNSTFNYDPLKEDFFAPAATLTWTFAENMQLRLAASETINRPQFRELTPSIFINTDTDDRFVGNPYLTNSTSQNFDTRFEWYFGPKEFFTVGGFYKKFDKPVEEFIFNGIGQSNATSFLNAPSAELYGLEVEFEKNYSFETLNKFLPIFGNGDLTARELVIRSNYTYTDSSVSANGDVTIVVPTVDPSQGVTGLVLDASSLYTDGRPMQGQSEHLANVQLGVRDTVHNYEATFLLNYTSDRIRAVEAKSDGLPAIIEQLPMTLDFVFNWDFNVRGGNYTLGLKAQNILGDNYEASQSLGGTKVITDSYELGTTIGASLKRRF